MKRVEDGAPALLVNGTEGTDASGRGGGAITVLLPVLVPVAMALTLSHRLLTASKLAPARPEAEPGDDVDNAEEMAAPGPVDRPDAGRQEGAAGSTPGAVEAGVVAPIPSRNGAPTRDAGDAAEATDSIPAMELLGRDTDPPGGERAAEREAAPAERVGADEVAVGSGDDLGGDDADEGADPAAAHDAVEGDERDDGTFRLSEAPAIEDETGDGEGADETETVDARPDETTEGADEEVERTVAGIVPVRRDRGFEKLRQRQKDAAEAAVNNVEDGMVPIAPFVRYVNTLTREVGELQRTVGQVSAERDLLQRQVYQLRGLPVPDELMVRPGKEAKKDAKAEVVASRQELRQDRQEGRAEAKAAKSGERATLVDGTEIDPDLVDRTLRMGRRRRLIALAVIALIGAGFYFGGRMGFETSGGFSRSSMANMAYVGQFVQIFLALWILYRIGRIGSKGVRFLFPSEEAVYRKQKRREKFLQGAAVSPGDGRNGGTAPQPLGNVLHQSAPGEDQPERDASQQTGDGQHERGGPRRTA